MSESRFEVLEEETHYPVNQPQRVDKQEEHQQRDTHEEAVEETLEQQLERLVLSVQNDIDAEPEIVKNTVENVKKASAAKELGNKYVTSWTRLKHVTLNNDVTVRL